MLHIRIGTHMRIRRDLLLMAMHLQFLQHMRSRSYRPLPVRMIEVHLLHNRVSHFVGLRIILLQRYTPYPGTYCRSRILRLLHLLQALLPSRFLHLSRRYRRLRFQQCGLNA